MKKNLLVSCLFLLFQGKNASSEHCFHYVPTPSLKFNLSDTLVVGEPRSIEKFTPVLSNDSVVYIVNTQYDLDKLRKYPNMVEVEHLVSNVSDDENIITWIPEDFQVGEHYEIRKHFALDGNCEFTVLNNWEITPITIKSNTGVHTEKFENLNVHHHSIALRYKGKEIKLNNVSVPYIGGVFDIKGVIVYRIMNRNLESENIEFDVSDLKNGIYFLKLLSDNGNYYQKILLN